MRRREAHDSSLDLLLDTVCNLFGMIIFIAVLAAVLAGARGAEQVEQAEDAAGYADEITELEADVQALLVREDDRVAVEIDSNRSKLREAESLGRQLEDAVAQARAILGWDAPTEDLEALQLNVDTLEQQLQDIMDLRDVTLRTPRRRGLHGRVPVQVVLTNDKLYVVNDWSAWRRTTDPTSQRCVFWTTWNTQAVDPAGSIAEDHGSCEYRTGALHIDRSIQLRSGGGFDPADPSGASSLSDLMAHLVPGRHVVSFRVTPDAFDRFHGARRLVVEQGLEYDVTPITPLIDGRYEDSIRQGTTTGQ